jgi:hypothetical protein
VTLIDLNELEKGEMMLRYEEEMKEEISEENFILEQPPSF